MFKSKFLLTQPSLEVRRPVDKSAGCFGERVKFKLNYGVLMYMMPTIDQCSTEKEDESWFDPI